MGFEADVLKCAVLGSSFKYLGCYRSPLLWHTIKAAQCLRSLCYKKKPRLFFSCPANVFCFKILIYSVHFSWLYLYTFQLWEFLYSSKVSEAPISSGCYALVALPFSPTYLTIYKSHFPSFSHHSFFLLSLRFIWNELNRISANKHGASCAFEVKGNLYPWPYYCQLSQLLDAGFTIVAFCAYEQDSDSCRTVFCVWENDTFHSCVTCVVV